MPVDVTESNLGNNVQGAATGEPTVLFSDGNQSTINTAAGTSPTSTSDAPTDSNLLSYPPDHEQTSGMWLNLVEFKYSRPSVTSQFTPTPTGTTISLPIPTNLSAGYSADWGMLEQSAIGHLVTTKINDAINNKDSLNNMIKNSSKKSWESYYNSFSDTIKNSGNLGKDFAAASGSDLIAGNNIANVVAGSQGLARNPWLAATFNGVGFRSWDFSYNFFPRSFDESKKLESIYTALKFGMHPAYDARFSNNLFEYPNMYAPSLTPNEYLFEFGFCVIKSVNIDYHGQGAPIYFADGDKKLPASVKLSFSLLEIEIVTKESIKGGSGNASISQAIQNRKYGGIKRGR